MGPKCETPVLVVSGVPQFGPVVSGMMPGMGRLEQLGLAGHLHLSAMQPLPMVSQGLLTACHSQDGWTSSMVAGFPQKQYPRGRKGSVSSSHSSKSLLP